jgi:hypothetical protein
MKPVTRHQVYKNILVKKYACSEIISIFMLPPSNTRQIDGQAMVSHTTQMPAADSQVHWNTSGATAQRRCAELARKKNIDPNFHDFSFTLFPFERRKGSRG